MTTTRQKKAPKAPARPKNHKLGQFRRTPNGAVSVLPPELGDEVLEPAAKSEKTVVAADKGTITIKVDGDADAQQAWDKDTELLAHESTVDARKENTKRAQDAKVEVAAKKLKTGSVVTSGTIEDIDISEYDKEDDARSKAAETTTPPPATEEPESNDDDLVELIENHE